MKHYDSVPVPFTRNHATSGAVQQLPVVVLYGLRQSGKSTLLQNEPARGRAYRTLDDFATLAARANPESLLKDAAILDEVQRCPELLVALKKRIDEERRPGRFIGKEAVKLDDRLWAIPMGQLLE